MKTFSEFLQSQGDEHSFDDEPLDVRREIDEVSRRIKRASGIIFNAKDSTLTDTKEYLMTLRDDVAEFYDLLKDFLSGRSIHI